MDSQLKLGDIERVACTHEKQLLVFAKEKWHTCLLDGKYKLHKESGATNSAFSEFVFIDGVGQFKEFAARIVFSSNGCSLTLDGMKAEKANGIYYRMLGGYRNANGFWYIKSLAGQNVIVFATSTGNKVVAVQRSNGIMEMDISISSSEIRELVNKFMWKSCKRIVDTLRNRNSAANNNLSLAVIPIENSGKGRRKNNWL